MCTGPAHRRAPSTRYLTPQQTHTLPPLHMEVLASHRLSHVISGSGHPPVAVSSSMADAYLIDFGFPQELALTGSQMLCKCLLN